MIMVHFFPIPCLVGMGLLVILLMRLRQQKQNPARLFFFSLFWIYLLILLDAVLFPLPLQSVSGPVLTRQNVLNTLSRVNFHFFYFGGHVSTGYIRTQILQNIFLTIPFGFGINFIARLRARDFLWLAAAVGLATELSQLLVSLIFVGGAYRGVDINDVLLNAAGVLLGYGLFRLFALGYLAITRKVRLEAKGLFGYIREVTVGQSALRLRDRVS